MFARVALDVPLPTLFDYRADAAATVEIGQRVAVPFGKRLAVGVVMEVSDHSDLPPGRLRRIEQVLDHAPLPPDVMALIRFCSSYYRHPIGQAVAVALPGPLRRLARPRANPERSFRLTAAGRVADLALLPARAQLKRQLMTRLAQEPHIDLAAVREWSSRGVAALKTLVELGWVESFEPAIEVTPPASGNVAAVPGPPLTDEQERALAVVRPAAGAFSVSLIHGVTGSGKTEIYLRLIADVLAAGRQALVLVPEINLTPQLEERFRQRFPGAVLVSLHSHLADGERLAGWRAAQSGAAHIVLGTRLSVFTPLPRLGLVVVDEEHDGSYKQAEGLRYSARDLAVMRGRLRDVPVVLGSATPSLETYHNALSGRYRLVRLMQRATGAMPRLECLDTRGQPLVEGLAPGLLDALRAALARAHQALVFINRRGYAPALLCRQCGWIAGCHRCSARLVYHRPRARLRCHHCGHDEPVVRACPACGNQDLAPLGHGTQRVEQALATALPGARVLRIDRDTTRRKAAWPVMRERIATRAVDVLVGTQMLAKGHDFPNLNLVVVLNADDSLFSTDFRSAERLFALLTQVAGRAGRGSDPGHVLIQTEFPDHPLYRALARNDYADYARSLLEERRQAGFPPFVHQALLRAEAPRPGLALEFLERAADAARGLGAPVSVYDPVPAAMARVAGHDRAQLLVQHDTRAGLQAFLADWHEALLALRESRVRWTLDVDPQEF